MSLQLNISNNLFHLAEKLCEDLRNQSLPVFQPYYIVTQTEGMNNWLKLQIAAHNKIAANVIFLKPNDLIHKIFFLLGGTLHQSKEMPALSWLIYHVLGESEFRQRFKGIAEYYAGNYVDSDRKRFALAEKLADMFDQYQVYRPEMISSWNEQGKIEWNENDWQQYIWHSLKQIAGDSFLDKTVISKYIFEATKNEQATTKIKSRIRAVHLFGLSVTTNFHFNIFNLLSEKIDINYYLLNPSPDNYWFDDKSEKQFAIFKKKGFADNSIASVGNPLLLSWGRVISDTFSLLFQNEELLNTLEEAGVAEPLNDTLLHKLQYDIYHNASTENRLPLALSDCLDGSVTINSCYTIAREVEVLYNYLVHLIDKRGEELSAKDIVVMATDIDAYAPYIKAVFGYAPYSFRFTIADESISAGDTIVSALHAVLSVNKANFTSERVVQLLDSTFIRKRFGISNVALVRKIVDRAGIRFGLECKKEDDTLYVSWPYGLDRIMQSICIAGTDKVIFDNEEIFLLDLPEGEDAFELIRLIHFVQVTANSIDQRKYERTIADWVSYIEDVLQNMIWDKEAEADDEFNAIIQQLEQLNITSELVTEKISFETFVQGFLKSIISVKRTGSFGVGGITFCSLIPMRSIPFKVVALLGMNFDKFPRKETPVSFNLMQHKRMKGDRNVKDNDKHLFLETLISAQQYLYISYVGQSSKDNAVLPPSAIVDELIDYIQEGCGDSLNAKQALVHIHPLHSFSNKYALDNDEYYSYLDKQTTPDIHLMKPTVIAQPNNNEINVQELIRFFQHPIKMYYNKILKISYEMDSVLLNETELFELNGLQKWTLKSQVLTLTDDEVNALKNRLVKTASLPLKNMAQIAFDEIYSEVQKIKYLFEECTNHADAQLLNIDLNVGNIAIKGNVGNIFGDKLIAVSFSKSDLKYMISAAIQYLIAQLQNEAITVHFISLTNEKVYIGNRLNKDDAEKLLTDLIQLFYTGQQGKLLYHPEFILSPNEIDELTEATYQKIIDGVFNHPKREDNDRYLLNEYNNGFFYQDNCLETFKENCRIILKPLLLIFPDYFNEEKKST